MNKFAMIMICALPALTLPAAAETSIKPGQWKVTAKTRMNGAAMPPRVKPRCLTPEQAGDLGKTFGPEMGAVNSTCERTQFEAADQTLKWRMQCKGQLDMDVAADFNFDSPTHYTATVVSKAWMAGAQINDVITELEGEHIGECQ